MASLNLSTQQAAAVAAMRQSVKNILIEATAGAGKTSTLIEMLKECDNKSVAFCAFGKQISLEIKAKIDPMGLKNVKVGTVHSFGCGAIHRAVSGVKMCNFKVPNLAAEHFTGEYEILRDFVVSAVDMAKKYGIGAGIEDVPDSWKQMFDHFNLWENIPTDVSEEQAIDASQYLLGVSNSIKNIIDYNDMVYLPVHHRMKIWQYDYVFLDEAQDTNNTRRELCRMMLKKGGRIVAVGDSRQAIFGFTGADSEAMSNIERDFSTIKLPLTVTYRCPKSIVQIANQWVSHIEAHESAPEGVVDSCELQDIVKLTAPGDVVICRNTKPLVDLAYSLLRQGIGCKVEGREIGTGLIKLATRWTRTKTVGELSAKVEEWKNNEVEKYIKRKEDSKVQGIYDRAETLEVFISQCDKDDPISVLVQAIRSLFDDTEKKGQSVLCLSTIHKSKGREWNRVFALGMDRYSPSPYARQQWEFEQEDNLCYVQVTRAKQHLTLVNVPAKKS